MQIILSIFLWILLALLILLLILLFTPVCVAVEVDYNKPKVWLRVLFFKFLVYPMKEKPEKDTATKEKTVEEKANIDKKASKKKSGKQSTRKKLEFELSVDKIISMLQAAGDAIKIIFKGLFFTNIQIVYPIYEEDSAQTAIAFGQTQAYFGGVAATLQNFINLSFKSVDFIPDFTGEHKYRRYFYCNIWSCAFIMIVAGIYALIKLKKENVI